MVENTQNKTPPKWRKLAKIAGLLTLTTACIISAGLLYLNSDTGRKTLADTISNAMSSPASSVEISAINGSLFSDMNIPSVKVSDAQGVWLDIQNITVQWSPLALLSKTFHAHNVEAETIVVSRTPETVDEENTENTEPFVLPLLPVDVVIDHYGISDIYWGTELIDATADLSLDGALRLTSDSGINARFELTGFDQGDDHATLNLSYPQDGSSLSILLEVSATEDGVLAAMSGLGLEQDATVSLSGDGPINDWNGEAEVTLGDTEISNSIINNTDRGFSLQTNINIAQFVPNELSSFASSSIELGLKIASPDSAGNRAILGEVSNDSAALEINSSIAVSQTPEFGETIFSIAAKDVAPINDLISPAYIEPLEINGSISDISGMPILRISVNDAKAGVLEQMDMTVNGEVIAVSDDQNITISTTGDVRNIEGQAFAITGELFNSAILWNVESDYDLSSGVVTADTIKLTHDDIEISGNGVFDSEKEVSEILMSASLPNLASILDKLGIGFDTSGAATLELTANQENSTAPIEATVTVTAHELSTESEIINQLIGTNPVLNVTADRDTDGNIGLSQFDFDADMISASASASLSNAKDITAGGFNIKLLELEKLADVGGPVINGDINIDGGVSGTASAPSLNIVTGFNSLDLQGVSLSNFETKATFNDILGNLRGNVTAQSISNYGPFALDVSIAKENEDITLPSIVAALGNYQLDGELQLPNGRAVIGNLSITTSEQESAPSIIDGAIALDLSLSESENSQHIAISGDLNDIVYSADSSTVISIATANIDGDIVLRANDPQISLNADLINLNHPLISSKQMSVEIARKNQGLGYLISAEGSDSQPFSLKLSGDVVTADDAQVITALLDGNINETPVSFNHADRIRISPDHTLIPSFTLGLGSGAINGEANIDSGVINARITASNADLRSLMSVAPQLPFSGILSGSAQYESNQDTIASNFELILSEIIFDEKISIAATDMTVSLSGDVNNMRSEISGSLSFPEEFEATFDAILPIDREPATNTLSLSQAETINGDVSLSGEIGSIWPALKLIDHDLSGHLDGALQLSGRADNPNIDGTISMTGGRYENMQTGFVASEIDLAANIEDRVFTLDRFNANDGEDGTILANADVKLNTDYSFEARAELNLKNAKLVRQPELSIEATTDLLFIKDNAQTSLSGEVVVNNADIGAIEQGGPSIATLDVTEINSDGIFEAEISEEDALGPVDLDLSLVVPGQLFVRSFGLDSEWKADLKVSGTSEEPIIAGTAEQIRGYFEFSGKRFDLTRGNFSFPGDQTNDPIIEIAAEHQLTDMVANLRIYGRASNPSLEMSSTPYLPENEVMARILFGASVADLTAVEAVQLASAVHSLSNGGGQGLMGGIRRAIGVDRLSIDNDGSREYGTTITGGKYLTDNVYVEVSTAPATGQTATSVEVGLTRNLSLVTRRTLDHDNNLSIRWSWDY